MTTPAKKTDRVGFWAGLRERILPSDPAIRMRRFELMLWAFLLSLAYYPGWFGVLAWLALARPILIISRLDPKKAWGSCYLFGFAFNLFSLFWIGQVTPPGMIATVLIVALYYALVLSMFNRIYHWRAWYGIVLLPFLWVGMEYARTLTEFAFPWSDLGYSQAYFSWVIQLASLGSVHLLSFAVISVNVLIALVLSSKHPSEVRIASGSIAMGIVILILANGWAVIPVMSKPPTQKVALLQGAMPLNLKWDENSEEINYRVYDSLISSVETAKPLLYVWPETAAPCYLELEPSCRKRVSDIVFRTGTHHLVGALAATTVGEERRYHNSCFHVKPDGVIDQRYDKVKLVPFAETVPYQDYLPFLRPEKILSVLTFIKTFDVQWWSDFRPGIAGRLFYSDTLAYLPLICFESTFPEYVRDLVNDGAELLVGITNDTWFEPFVGVDMHERIFLTRCVENRIWGARAANTGYSEMISPYGEISSRLPRGERAAIVGLFERKRDTTFFGRHGDYVGFLCSLILAACIGIFSLAWIRNRVFRRNVAA
jgi:apolipoprotein N-acyltransferase